MSSQQQIKGDSLRRQLELSKTYARDNDLILDHSLRDIGVSAWTGANVKSGALGRFLELVQAGRVAHGSYLLVESLDRLSRERVIDALEPFLSILRAGIIVVSLADKQVYSAETVGDNFTQLMMSLAIMARAHEESQIKSQRITKAHASRRANATQGIGKFSAQMWGWIDQIEVEPKRYEYRLNDHAKTVAKVFELSDAGLGCMKIELELIRLKMMGVKGKPISNGNIAALLKNEAVIGTYQPTHVVDGKKVPYGEALKNFLPAAVSEEVFWRVQRNKRKPPVRGRKGNNYTNLFPGLLVCAHCGERVMLSVGGMPQQRYTYVQCSKKYKTRDCHNNKGTFRYDVLEKAILDNVSEFQDDPFAGRPDASRQNLVEAVARQERKVEELEKRRANLMASLQFAESDADRREISAERNLLRSQADEARNLLEQQSADLKTHGSRAREKKEFADRVKIERLVWTTGDASEVYQSRSRVALLIGKTITQISVNFETKSFMAMIGHERAYIFDRSGQLVNKFDARTAGYYNTGTNRFSTETDGNGKEWVIAHRPMPWDQVAMTSDIAIRTISDGLNTQLSPEVVDLQEQRKSLVSRLPVTQTKNPVNPRLDDPEVIALKERRRRGDKPSYHPDNNKESLKS